METSSPQHLPSSSARCFARVHAETFLVVRSSFSLTCSYIGGLQVRSSRGEFLLVHREDGEITMRGREARESLPIRALTFVRVGVRCRLHLRKPRIVVAPSFLLRCSPSFFSSVPFFFFAPVVTPMTTRSSQQAARLWRNC